MALFRRKTKETILFRKSFTQSESFKGFRRVKLTTHKEKDVPEALAYFAKSDFDFRQRTITVECKSVPDAYTTGPMKVVNVYVDGKRIGCVYGSVESRYSMLAEYDYDQAHIKVDDGDVYLYVHYTDGGPLKAATEVR